MDKNTGYGTQRYTLPRAFDEKRRDWIKARWSEDYYITSVAGENVPGAAFSWTVVMSHGAPFVTQS